MLRRPALAAALLLVTTAAAAAGEVVLHRLDLVRDPSGVLVAPVLALPGEDRTLPLVGDGAAAEAAAQVRALDRAGQANGFAGIVYDNRDRGHSRLKQTLFPRLTHLVYGPDLRAAGLDQGLAGDIVLPAVVLGNSSTAVTGGPAPRSLPRFAMTRPGEPERAARLYEADHIHVYPEHRDHDADDLFPANWPYMVTTQGSSGSDQPMLEALSLTLAAFEPATFARMREEGLVAPTLQMILRRSLVDSPEAYRTGAAHPVVFDTDRLRPDRMVAMAAELAPDAVPPEVRIAVVSEDFRARAGLAALDERLFDTPAAVARLWRGFEWEKTMVVEARAPGPGGEAATFSWHLLQGDPARVAILPLDPEGRRAELRISWHDAFAAGETEEGAARTTARVDVGVFASGGAAESAPAFVSVSFPVHERRTYAEDPGGTVGLVSVDYDAEARGAAYDPLLHWSAPWRDRAVRRDGLLAGWWREGADGARRFLPAAPNGETGRVYEVDRSDPARPVLRPTD